MFGCMYSCGSLAKNFTIIYVGLISVASKLCERLVWGFCSSSSMGVLLLVCFVLGWAFVIYEFIEF